MRRTVMPAAAMLCATVLCGAAAHAATFKLLFSFNGTTSGTWPDSLVAGDGYLYGTTVHPGTATCLNGCADTFKMDPSTGTELNLPEVPASGTVPTLGFYRGVIYGASAGGGANAGGSIFRMNHVTGAQQVIYSVPSIDSGIGPEPPIYGNGTLYGYTSYGGPTNSGMVYSLDQSTGEFTVLHGFTGRPDGRPPVGLIYNQGTLYGVTSSGGKCGIKNGCGTVFKIDPATATETILYDFAAGADGLTPSGGLTISGGFLFGSTLGGGTGVCPSGAVNGCGTIFKTNLTTGATTILYSFASLNPNDGAAPSGHMVNRQGKLYGVTVNGGLAGGASGCPTRGCGTIYKIDIATGKETVLYNFTQATGVQPSTLIYKSGTLYGIAQNGGTSNNGVVFSLTP